MPTMATVRCALGKRGRPSHEWNDGKKDRIYCLGRVDPMTDDPLPECLDCPDFVNKEYYVCNDCGAVFSVPDKHTYRENLDGENGFMTVVEFRCPFCGSDEIEEAD